MIERHESTSKRTRRRWADLALWLPLWAMATMATAHAAGEAAPAKKAAAAGRSADAVLADYGRALGGEAPWRKVKAIKLEVAVTIQGLNISGTGQRVQTADGRFHESLNIPGIGTLERGSDGKKHWSRDPIHGLRLLAGAEAEQSRIETAWMAELRLKKLYRKVKAVTSPDGALECLEFAPRLGQPATRCFDRESHLLVKQTGVQSSPQGETPYQAVFKDYREQEGWKMPFLHEVTTGPVTLRLTIKQVITNPAFDQSVFKLPAAP